MFEDQTVELLPDRTTLSLVSIGNTVLNLNVSPAVNVQNATAVGILGNARATNVGIALTATRQVGVIR